MFEYKEIIFGTFHYSLQLTSHYYFCAIITLLYEIHNCSNESATPSIPLKQGLAFRQRHYWHNLTDIININMIALISVPARLLIKFLPRDRILRHFRLCKFWNKMYDDVFLSYHSKLVLGLEEIHYLLHIFVMMTWMLTIMLVERESLTQHWSWAREASIFSIGG